jgi:hypothetical protein
MSEVLDLFNVDCLVYCGLIHLALRSVLSFVALVPSSEL